MNIQKINIKLLRIDGGTQSRVSIDEQVVANYAEAMTEGATLPPVIVFRDGANDWLADGFHRFHANVRIGAVDIDAEVRTGTQRDAVLYSVGANGKHGLPPSNADKRKAVAVLLSDPEWAAWSDREIAKRCHVSHTTVAVHRSSLVDSTSENTAERTYTTKHGTTAAMDTTGQKKAGKARAAKPEGTSTATETASTVTAEQKAPGPVTVAEAPEPAEDDGTEVDVLAEWEAAQKEIEALTGVLQAAEADDLKAEAMKWRRAYDNAVRKQSEAMDRCVTYERELQRQSRTIQRIGKAIGESNPSKVAAAVEALVKSQQVDA